MRIDDTAAVPGEDYCFPALATLQKRATVAAIFSVLCSHVTAAQAGEQSDAAQQPSDNHEEASAGHLSLEEVIVTAQKREERLKDVPISISVLSGKDLDQSTEQNVGRALARVPGVALTPSFQGGSSSIAVRGVTAPSSLFTGSGPIGYYLDSVPFAFVNAAITPDVDAYDLERVEVLRGPQGTLYGASSQNGVVRVLTQDANLREVEFKGRVSGSGTQGGGENYRGDMAVNVPLIADKLAIRAVAGYQDWSGWIDRSYQEDANSQQLQNYRLKVNALPTDKLSVGLSAWISRNDADNPSYGSEEGTYGSGYDEPGQFGYDAYGLRLGYELPWFSINSATSYLDYTTDNDLNVFYIGLPTIFLTTGLESRIIAQEINFLSTSAGPWRWSFGTMYRDARDQVSQYFHDQTGAFALGAQAPRIERFSSESIAVYGQVTRLLLDDRLEITGGLRYFEDRSRQRVLQNQDLTPPSVRAFSRFDATSPRAVVTWHATESTNVYVSYAEGFRSGVNQSANLQTVIPDVRAADPDNLKNYEVGVKGDFFQNRLSLDAAFYYEDWEDVQQQLSVRSPTGPSTFIGTFNGTSASGAGLEFGVTARPIPSLTLSLDFSMNDLTQDADVLQSGVVLFRKGERLNHSPEYTAGSAAEYEFSLGAGGLVAMLSASANYTAKQDTRSLLGTTVIHHPGDALLNVGTRVSVESPVGWRVTLFADNLSNEQGSPEELLPSRNPSLLTEGPSVRLRPRTIGLQLDYRFRGQ